MADIFIDGFDKYGPTGISYNGATGNPGFSQSGTSLNTLITQGEWTSTTVNGSLSSGMEIVNGLSTTGYGLKFAQSGSTAVNAITQIQKTLPNSYGTVIGGVRFIAGLESTGITAFIEYSTGSSTQFSIAINYTAGTISILTGAPTTSGGAPLGTLIATSSASVSAGTTHYLEWQVTIGSAASYNIYLDSVSILSGTGNTASAGGTTANHIGIGLQANEQNASVSTFQIDDLYLFDNTTGTNNAPLLTNPRIETQFPNGDNQTQFTNVGSVIGKFYSATSGTNAPGANELFLVAVTPSVNSTLNSVSCVPSATSAGANFTSVLYADSSGSPGSLIASGTQVTGATANISLTSNFSPSQSLTGGTQYWIGFITDTSVALWEADTTTNGQKKSNTYTSGAPNPAGTMTTGQNSWQIWGNCSGTSVNWVSEYDNPSAGTNSSVQSSTSGTEDLYSFPNLTVTPTNIYTVCVKSNWEISASGPRTANLQTKSASTDSSGSNSGISPSTSPTWGYSFFDTDPNTSAAWIASGLNAAVSGIKVAS